MLSHLKALLCICNAISICSIFLLHQNKNKRFSLMKKTNKDLGQNLLEIFYFIDPVFPVNQSIFRKICHLHSTQHRLWTV